MISNKRRKILEVDDSDEEAKPDNNLRRISFIPLETRRRVLVHLENFRKQCALAYAWSLTDDCYNRKLIKVVFCYWWLHSSHTEDHWETRRSLIGRCLNVGCFVHSPVISKSAFSFHGRPCQRPVEGERGRKKFEVKLTGGSFFSMEWTILNMEIPLDRRWRRQGVFSCRPLVKIQIGYDQMYSDGVGFYFVEKQHFTTWGGIESELVVIDDENDRRAAALDEWNF